MEQLRSGQNATAENEKTYHTRLHPDHLKALYTKLFRGTLVRTGAFLVSSIVVFLAYLIHAISIDAMKGAVISALQILSFEKNEIIYAANFISS